MADLKKDSEVIVNEGKNQTWKGKIINVLWNVNPPSTRKGATRQGYEIVPLSSEHGGIKIVHHSMVRKDKSKPLVGKKRKK